MLDEIEQRLTPDVVPMGSADGLGTRTASFAPFGPADGDLAERARAGELHPVFFGSALTGAGVEEVMRGIAQLLPARAERRRRPALGPCLQDRARPGRRPDRLHARLLRES